MHKLTELIRSDMKPAFGVTEPGAIAFAVAKARAYTEGEIKSVDVKLNSGMYKNAFTCGIPNSNYFGNLYAAALGAIAADADLELESLTNVTPEDDAAAAKMVEDGKVTATMSNIASEISIVATVVTTEDECTVNIKHSHTHIESIILNGKEIMSDVKDAVVGEEAEEEAPEILKCSFHEIVEYAKTVAPEEIAFIRDAFTMNLALLDEGLKSGKAPIAVQLYEENGSELISANPLKTAQLLCNGAIEARVLGLSRPAMSITGSGSHGIIATMPLYAYHKIRFGADADDTELLRATALSYLITMFIKEYSGKLSAFCGCGIAAGTGMACGLALMQDADEDQLFKVILNMSAGIVGMVCDGGNHGCAVKGIVATDAAFRSVALAMKNVCIEGIHGISGLTPEDTMRNMGLIASEGMVETEGTILKIMENK
ncbi:MAG: serine dehydratase subunit alpha family protein [Clostridiales bacterium]|nr:serine dehydratase subunit alpha family protein [Candidatus Crickella merdequi]